MSNKNDQLHAAKKEKNDEFYTQYQDVETEMNAYIEFDQDVFRGKTILCPCDDPSRSAFTEYFLEKMRKNDLGIKKIICTSYAYSHISQNPTAEEKNMSCFDEEKHFTHGRIFEISDDMLFPSNARELGWKYLKGDGDFRSDEVSELRNASDIVITNGPFSLFRELISWILSGNKKFIILGNQNAITYKEIFPLIKNNQIWLGCRSLNRDMYFDVPDERKEWLKKNKKEGSAYKVIDGIVMGRLAFACWFTNIDHAKRHEPLQLMTMADNLKYNKKLKKKLEKDYGKVEYPHYDNYDAIEVPLIECIPSDYKPCWYTCDQAKQCPYALSEGMNKESDALCEHVCSGNMGVPITYLEKHNPDQIEIIKFRKGNDGKDLTYTAVENDNPEEPGARSQEPGARSQEPGARSQEPEARSQKPGLCLTSELSSVTKCNGFIGVPITFLNKFNPSQFRIIGFWNTGTAGEELGASRCTAVSNGRSIEWNGPTARKRTLYFRIIIQTKM